MEKLKELEMSSTFKQSEIKANNLCAYSLLVFGAFVVLVWIFSVFNVFEIDKTIINIVVIGSVIITATAFLINRYFEGNRQWLKSYLLTSAIIVISGFNLVYPYLLNSLLYAFPIVISCFYYSRKLTKLIFLSVCVIMFCVSTFSVFYGYIDANYIVVEQGVINYFASYGKVLLFKVLPDILLLIFLTIVCVLISERTRALIDANEQSVRKDERIQTELNIASNIQNSILPKLDKKFSSNEKFDIFARMMPAKEVAGDFYDCFMLDETHLVFIIADVSGKGVPASMFMFATKTLLNNRLKSGVSIEKSFDETNNQLCQGNDLNMFVTMWGAVVDIETGIVEYVNAGHNPPLLKRKEQKIEFLQDAPDIVIGIMQDFNYEKHTLKLEKGDLIFLYTDGAVEAINSTNEQFGNERLQQQIEQTSSLSLETMFEQLNQKIVDFCGEVEQFDDITMIGFRYK